MSTTETTIVAVHPRPSLAALLAEMKRRGLRIRAGRDPDDPRFRTLDILQPERATGLWPAIETHFSALHTLAESVAQKGATA